MTIYKKYPLLKSPKALMHEYHVAHKTMSQIARELGVPMGVVVRRMIAYNLPRRRSKEAHFRYFSWSEDVAYAVGVIRGDGHSRYNGKGNYLTVLCTIKLSFAQSFYDALVRIGLHPHAPVVRPPSKGHFGKNPLYWVSVCSKQLYRFAKMDLVLLEKLQSADLAHGAAFVRGFYESEGSITRRKDGRNLKCAISNTDRELLELVLGIISRLGFTFHLNGPYQWGTINRKPMYLLQSGRTKEIKAFLDLIKPCIKTVPP